jgi:hypothetical protein
MHRLILLTPALFITACTSSEPEQSPPDQAVQDQAAQDQTAQVQPAAPLPDGIDPAQSSDDPTYASTKENPVIVGGPEGFSGPESERLYLRHLRDHEYKPMTFTRRGSSGAGPDGHILDAYELTASDGSTFTLYIDMYHTDVHPFSVKAPKGMYFFK